MKQNNAWIMIGNVISKKDPEGGVWRTPSKIKNNEQESSIIYEYKFDREIIGMRDMNGINYNFSPNLDFIYLCNNGDKFMVIACDGLWDVLSNQDAVEFINSLLINKNYKGNLAKDLADYAYLNKSMDNITVLVYLL